MNKECQSVQEPVFCIIKFGELAHLESLLNKGELCFNSTLLYNKMEQSNPEKGDGYEGAEWVENIFIKEINFKHQKLGSFHFKPDTRRPFKFIQYNHNYLSCSFFIITAKDFEKTDVFKLNRKMMEFGSHALVIKEPNRFLAQLKNALDRTAYSYRADRVEYRDLSIIGRHEMNPFIKKKEHRYQKEYRVILKNQLDRKYLRLGPINEYAELISSESLVEGNWEVIRS